MVFENLVDRNRLNLVYVLCLINVNFYLTLTISPFFTVRIRGLGVISIPPT